MSYIWIPPGTVILKVMLLFFLPLLCLYAEPAMRTRLGSSTQPSHSKSYLLQHTAASEYAQNAKLPCAKCRICPIEQSASLLLIAPTQNELALLESWVQLMDVPKPTYTITLYCLVIQEHEIENFLSHLLYESSHLVQNWKEGIASLLLEMERSHGVTVVASPRLVTQTGKKSFLNLSDDFRLSGYQSHNSQQIDMSLCLQIYKEGQDGLGLELDLSQKMSLRSLDNHSMPSQSNTLKTKVPIAPNQIVFLGSAGQWSWVHDQGSFSFLKILPQALIPFFHYDQGSKSQLIILAECS